MSNVEPMYKGFTITYNINTDMWYGNSPDQELQASNLSTLHQKIDGAIKKLFTPIEVIDRETEEFARITSIAEGIPLCVWVVYEDGHRAKRSLTVYSNMGGNPPRYYRKNAQNLATLKIIADLKVQFEKLAKMIKLCKKDFTDGITEQELKG